MEHLVAVLDKFLNGSPRAGWIMFVFGTAMILLGRFEVLPSPEIIPGWQTLFWGCIALGAAMLLISFGAWIFSKIRVVRHQVSENEAAEARFDQIVSTGNTNADLLPPDELEALLFVLRANKQRFVDRDFRWGAGAGLINRHVVFRDRSSHADDIFYVNERVWVRREEILSSNATRLQDFRPW